MISQAQPLDKTKKYYSIGEVAKLLNLPTSVLRFWEKEFPHLQPQKNKQGARRYTPADIAKLQKIYQLVKKQGYTLQGAREALKHSGSQPQHSAEVLSTLKELRSFLVALKELLPS